MNALLGEAGVVDNPGLDLALRFDCVSACNF
jgi:hypothetical protein